MKKVIIVTSGIKGPTLAGGIGTAFYNLALLLAKNNFDVSILYASHPYYGADEKNPNYWIEDFRQKGITFIPLIDNTQLYGQDMMQRSYKILNYFNNTQTKYDKVIFHDYGGIAYYSVLAKKFGLLFQNTDLIINAHGNTRLSDNFNSRYPQDHNGLITYYLEQRSLELCDIIISPSEFYINWYRNEGYNLEQQKCHVIQNIIEHNNDILGIGSYYDKIHPPIHICFFGRIEKLKGIFVLLDSLTELIKEHPEYNDSQFIKLSLIGNLTTINGTNIINYINPYLENFKFNTEIVDDKNSDDALKYIKESNGFIINPSLGENSPYTILEALEYNIPFIASSIPGIKELVHPNFHQKVLFTPGDKIELRNKILSLLTNSHKNDPPIKRQINNKSNNLNWIKLLSRQNILSAKGNKSLNKPFVSVCVPTTGKRDITSDTLLSLSRQSYLNFDINIVIDGGNMDLFVQKHSLALKTFEERGIKVSICQIDTTFKPGACNFAVKNMCKGEYVLFFDDDDIAKPEMIERYATLLNEDNDIDVLTDFCQTFEVDEQNGEKFGFSSEKIILKHVSLGIGNSLSSNLLINYFGKANFIVKKSRFLEIGGMSETESLTPYVDWDFFVKASINKLRIEITPEVLYYYRMNSSGSLFYSSHGTHELQGLEKRYLAHRKIINTVSDSENFPSTLKDYVSYSQFQLALPQVTIKKPQEPNNLKPQLDDLKNQIKDLQNQKEWYENTYEKLPIWWKKVGSLLRYLGM